MQPAIAKLVLLCLLTGSSLIAHGSKAEDLHPVEIKGDCIYSDDLAPLIEQNHNFAICDRLVIRRDDDPAELTFSHPSRLQSVKFRGAFGKEGRFEVSAIRLRSASRWEDAEGQCEFYQTGSNYSLVTCLVTDGPRYFVVNFVPGS